MVGSTGRVAGGVCSGRVGGWRRKGRDGRYVTGGDEVAGSGGAVCQRRVMKWTGWGGGGVGYGRRTGVAGGRWFRGGNTRGGQRGRWT